MPGEETIVALEEAIHALLPKGADFAVCEIPQNAVFDFEEEARVVKQAGDYRKCEFLAGRACARAAMSKLGVRPAPIVADEDGLPVWPEGVIAVISHSRGYCAACAANRAEYRVLGLDLEKTDRLSPAAMERVVHTSEAGFVNGSQKMASLLFCAKEAFYKAQYPEWRTSANFHDLALAVDMERGSARISYMHPRFPEDLRSLAGLIEFRFRFFGDFVVCLCWMKNLF